MKKSYDSLYSYKYLLPIIAVYLLLFIFPIVQGVYYSFTNWSLFSAQFTGISNYINIIKDPDLNLALKNTLIFAIVTTIFKVLFGLALALFLNRTLKTAKLMRTIFFLPCVISNVAVGLTFSAILHPDGILNSFFRAVNLGFLAQNWLTDPKIVMFSLAAIEIWKWSGFGMTIFLSGLQTIPYKYYEAAYVDGVKPIQKLIYITIPLIMPTFNNTLIISLIGGLRVFDIVYAVTQGGPGGASEILNTYTFYAFGQSRYGEASAASVILAVLVVTVSMSSYWLLRKKEVEL